MGGDVELYEAGLLNRGNQTVTVNCMVADGLTDGTFTVATQYPQSISLAPGAAGWLDWSRGIQNGGQNWIYPALNCQLPPNVEISYNAILYKVEIGS